MGKEMETVLGVDLGTSYFKLGLFDHKGELRGLGRVFVPKDRGDGDRCQVPVERFWTVLRQALADACRQAGARPHEICSLSYASQANSFLLLDKHFSPVTPLILWPDNRAEGMKDVDSLFDRNTFLDTTGMGIPCSHQFCLPKLLWLQQQCPKLVSRAAYLMTLSDYFTWSLTGERVGDAGTASLLGLLDQRTLSWSFGSYNFSDPLFSKPLRPGTLAGAITPSGGELLGLKSGIPLVVGSLDHHMAAIGAGVGRIADLSESTGTVLACLKLTDRYSPMQGICTGTGTQQGEHYQLAFADNGAGALQWYLENHAQGSTFMDLEKQASRVPIGCEGLVARARADRFAGLEGFLHIADRHHAGHFTRALFESTALTLAELVQRLCGNIPPHRIVATGGGAGSDLWLQIKADLLGIEIVTGRTPVPACHGAAMLAAIAAGWFPDLFSAADNWIHIRNTYIPDKANHQRYRCRYQTQWED
ncbi:FGGY-family carbohydrate kinase [candidate division KSB1 bacterium]|nr:FGGY-family carbohydrate kinase [candidate division KSB1 bacterium]